jgi:non-heme chloroperoxidase
MPFSAISISHSEKSDDTRRKEYLFGKGAKEIYYPGAPHGLTATHQDQVNAELVAFIKA